MTNNTSIKTFFLASLAFCCLLFSCKKTVVPQDSKEKAALSYLALGDSYTIGESVDPSLRWPVQLSNALKIEGVDIASPTIIAKTGWTTDELNTAIDEANIDRTYNLVSLLIGVNNQFRGRSASEFKSEFRALLQRALGFAANKKERVFVVSIPDYGVTPFAKSRNPLKIAMEIDEYNQLSKEVCEEMDILFVNITPISRMASTDPALIAGDGLHPSGKMYGEWVDLMLEDIVEKLK